MALHWKILIGFASTGIACCLAFVLGTMIMFGEFNRVFPGRDARYVGEWWALRRGELWRYEFLRDGTGHFGPGPGDKRLTWGSSDGKLQVMYMATDYWSNPIFESQFFDGEKHLKLSVRSPWGRFPSDMYRDRTEAMKHELHPQWFADQHVAT